MRSIRQCAVFLLLVSNSSSCGDSAVDPAGSAFEDDTNPAGVDTEVPGQGGDGHVDPAADGGVAVAKGLPCDVGAVLSEHCSHCHGSSPAFGAPMSLVSYEDLTATSGKDPTQSVYSRVGVRIHDTKSPMPPPPHGAMAEADVATLDAWIKAGAPRSNETCNPFPGPGDGPSAQDDFDYSQCDQRVSLKAHNGTTPDDDTPFKLDQQVDNRYECFYFKLPFDAEMQGLAVFPLIDDERVLHHWLLYTEEGAPYQDGAHEECKGVHPNATLVTGWAPGGEGLVMPPDVGLHLPKAAPDTFFILEIHYNNSGRHPDALDRSGAEICTTSKLRKNVAGVHWLGTENLLLGAGKQDFTGTCTPQITEPIHILGFSPHMHVLGRHMKTTIERAAGGTEIAFDKPFSFENQGHYPDEITIYPGDTLKTTCTYENDTGGAVFFGEKTTDEMCYQFTLAYPLGAFNTGGDLLFLPGSVTGDNKCMR